MSGLAIGPWLLVLASCGAAPESPSPGAGTKSPSPQELPESFLHGTWGPRPDFAEAQARIDAFRDGGYGDDYALSVAYGARLQLAPGGTGQLGLGRDGEIEGDALRWRTTRAAGGALVLELRDERDEPFATLQLERQGDTIVLRGRPHLAGTWLRLQRGAAALAEDRASGESAREHGKALASRDRLDQGMREALQKRQETYHSLVRLVRSVCRADAALGHPRAPRVVRGEQAEQMRRFLAEMEAALQNVDSPLALRSPVPEAQAASARAFVEEWFAGTWAPAIELVDFERILPGLGAAERDEVRSALASRRRRFALQGEYVEHFQDPRGRRESRRGHWALARGPGEWVHLVFVHEIGGAAAGLQEDRYELVPAFRDGELVWIGEPNGPLIPHRRVGP